MSLDAKLFENRLQNALERVRVVLGANKAPQFATDIQHQYDDKYYLAECMTNTAISSQANSLVSLGLTAEHVATLRGWVAAGSAASLRFRAEERCTFDREESREVENPRKRVEEVSIGSMISSAVTSKVVTTVTEYFWKYECMYELLAVRGAGDSDKATIFSRSSHTELKTATKSATHPAAKVPAIEADVNITWLIRQLEADGAAQCNSHFKIDRAHKKCHTPRRNPSIDDAQSFFNAFKSWGTRVCGYLQGCLAMQPDPTMQLDLGAVMGPNSVFLPVLPLLAERAAGAIEDSPASDGLLAVLPRSTVPGEVSSALLPMGDMNRLLAEESRELREKCTELSTAFPAGNAVASAAEAIRAVTLRHCTEVCGLWMEAVDYIEGMLRKQVIDAIGKEVSPADFADYMVFHNRKLFADAYAPSPFCFAVRRSPKHSPEGTVSIEQTAAGGGGESNIASPIVTVVAQGSSPHPMQFPLGASTNIHFNGDRYLHAWLSHRFSGQSGAKLSLVSRARQFSSMLVLVGRIASAHAFEPKYAAIVKDKDELSIPLDLTTIPTPKEFKDAIESLSPEQQNFAKAFRSMQLESTLFGILVIHIKPQLERVLNLADDSLTKEIKLTQDLMQLFIKYQIPSDLLSFDATDEETGVEVLGATSAEKLEKVKGHVKAMNEMIEASKQEEIEGRRMEATWANPMQVAERGGGWDDSRLEEAVGALKAGGARSRGSRGGGGGMMMTRCAAAAPPPPMMAMAAFACAGETFGAAAIPPPPASAAAVPRPEAAAPAPPSSVQPQQNAAAALPPPKQPRQEGGGVDFTSKASGVRDYTRVPKEMDERFEVLDSDKALRPTIISPGTPWTKKAQKALLASATTVTLDSDAQKTEKDAAFDLLDALTKSGALPIEHASLHVVVAATHCFDKTVTETVVQEGSNPIERVERSTLIMATTVHQKPAAELIREAQLPRVLRASPALFDAEGEGAVAPMDTQ